MSLVVLQEEIVACRKCPRLIEHCQQMAQVKRRAFREWEYWGRPLPSWGDPAARVLVLGLAPAAHGGNRTGRMFTGDRSGDFLFRALHAAGFAAQPTSSAPSDGQALRDVYISNAVRCAPPDNKPTTAEVVACRGYLARELALLPQLQGVVALGKLAFDNVLAVRKEQGRIASRSPFVFGHNRVYALGENAPWIAGSYHPSQQNTCTGRLTEEMLLAVFAGVRTKLR